MSAKLLLTTALVSAGLAIGLGFLIGVTWRR